MSLPGIVGQEHVEHEQVGYEQAERELDLLIREARRRQRRRRLRLAVLMLAAFGSAGVVAASASGWLAELTDSGPAHGRSASTTGGRCPVSPVRWVANAQFDAYVLGNGPFRLGMGVRYDLRSHQVVLGQGTPHWGAIEAIWWLARPGRLPETITVRGVALGTHAPIEVRPSNGGLAPGRGPLVFSNDFHPARNASPFPTFYPGSVWLRTGGCYALNISGRGFHERLVLDVAQRSA